MSDRIVGIHHITAIAGDAQCNYDFYTRVLGLRLVKKTVNFDDPGTYHFYYGNETGTPGTILTFFPWARVKPGKPGTGMATHIDYSIPAGSLDFWNDRLEQHMVHHEKPAEKLGEPYLAFTDPDGLQINLTVSSTNDDRACWMNKEINEDAAIKGFHGVTLTLKNVEATAGILTELFGYYLLKQEGNVYRYITDAVENAAIVDLMEMPDGLPGIVAGGANHHVAFRVKNDEILMHFREKVVARGLYITEKIDRNYFYSLYFREPGGVLFEIASDNPGFATDESVSELGTHLMLPPQYERERNTIEKILPKLEQ